ncbi:MAG TPA: hypothetical protein HPP80_05605, partial [Rhodospirillaceae bacterium]|nr:hypothetical protein [Rhodospirillaceae bacterium]
MRGTLIRHGRLAAWLGLTALTVLLAACGEMSQSAGLEPLAADREQ